MIYVEILAGGKGTRMGNTDMPKQFLMLGTKPIIIHTVEQFLINNKISKIIVCCPKDWISHMNDLIKKYIPNSDIDIVCGGSSRNETIINGCKHIKEKYGINDDDVIVTHDAVRPFITQRIIDENIEALSECDAVDTVIPATDTIVESRDSGYVSNIPNRSYFMQGQTPQSFNIKKLIKYYMNLTEEQKNILTDACKIFILNGDKVKIINGETYNIKITTMHDLKIANSILMERGKK
ncbi:MAG: 2-C-methyl-D-erythritol 4-phosphate cytidylyltransferase [bacterium]|nr:2-C-methyl-D-erythritol 4-phosphate cytidylyltransferase [bacterium]